MTKEKGSITVVRYESALKEEDKEKEQWWLEDNKTEIVWKKRQRQKNLILKHKKFWAEAGGVFKPLCVIDEPVKATHQVCGRQGGRDQGEKGWRQEEGGEK